MPSFAQNLEKTLHSALANASERRHEYATLEHLLLALIDDEDAAQVMGACGVDLAELGEVVKTYLDQEYQSLKTEEDADPQPTAGFQRVIQRAILHVQSSGKDVVTGANVLVALFSERDSYAVYFLQQQDMSRLDAVSYISHGIGKGGKQIDSVPPQGAEDTSSEEKTGEAGGKKETALDQFTVNLNAKAEAGKVDPLIGRGPEVDRTIQILCRRSKNNPLYVGEAGVVGDLRHRPFGCLQQQPRLRDPDDPRRLGRAHPQRQGEVPLQLAPTHPEPRRQRRANTGAATGYNNGLPFEGAIP